MADEDTDSMLMEGAETEAGMRGRDEADAKEEEALGAKDDDAAAECAEADEAAADEALADEALMLSTASDETWARNCLKPFWPRFWK